ncbi:MAG: DUF4190 domain-containing protein [Candidatus Woesearchaeota archaeon]
MAVKKAVNTATSAKSATMPVKAQGESSMLALWAFIVGIVAVVLFWVPYLNILLMIGAIVLGIVAIVDAKRTKPRNRWMAITGLILGIVSILIPILAAIGALVYFGSLAPKHYIP